MTIEEREEFKKRYSKRIDNLYILLSSNDHRAAQRVDGVDARIRNFITSKEINQDDMKLIFNAVLDLEESILQNTKN